MVTVTHPLDWTPPSMLYRRQLHLEAAKKDYATALFHELYAAQSLCDSYLEQNYASDRISVSFPLLYLDLKA